MLMCQLHHHHMLHKTKQYHEKNPFLYGGVFGGVCGVRCDAAHARVPEARGRVPDGVAQLHARRQLQVRHGDAGACTRGGRGRGVPYAVRGDGLRHGRDGLEQAPEGERLPLAEESLPHLQLRQDRSGIRTRCGLQGIQRQGARARHEGVHGSRLSPLRAEQRDEGHVPRRLPEEPRWHGAYHSMAFPVCQLRVEGRA